MKKGILRGIVCFVGIVLIWTAVSFPSRPLSDAGEISLEDFVVCRVQVMRVENDTGYGRAAELRDAEQVQKVLDALGEMQVRKMMPWEKPLSDSGEPYLMVIQYDSEKAGRFETLSFRENGRIDFRGAAYLLTEKPKTKATDLLEMLLEEYETK